VLDDLFIFFAGAHLIFSPLELSIIQARCGRERKLLVSPRFGNLGRCSDFFLCIFSGDCNFGTGRFAVFLGLSHQSVHFSVTFRRTSKFCCEFGLKLVLVGDERTKVFALDTGSKIDAAEEIFCQNDTGSLDNRC
jgi:hypothetical protein